MDRALLLLLVLIPLSTVAVETTIDSGVVRGRVDLVDGVPVASYRGIPFAAPPTGPRRFLPPEPVPAWSGVRDCLDDPPACPQPASAFLQAPARQDEDCLALNVFAPVEPDRPLPVLVWIHGGGFVVGAAGLPWYDGRRLAARGAVVICIQYRLGPFGFLALPDDDTVTGNQGLADQVLALRWVRNQAAAFGGDPNRVTLVGESAGAVAVGLHLILPASRGLFHGAILQSGTPLTCLRRLDGDDPATSARAQGRRLLSRLGARAAQDGRSRLQALSAEALLAAAEPGLGLLDRATRFGPVIDGTWLPRPPRDILHDGHQARVPVIIGSNADEGTFFTATTPAFGPLAYRLLLRRTWGTADAARIADAYPLADRDQSASVLARLLSDSAFHAPARQLARLLASQGQATWCYRFERIAPGLADRGLGATHGAEVPYIFGQPPPRFHWQERDRQLATLMAGHWLAFASEGAVGEGWPRATATGGPLMVFGAVSERVEATWPGGNRLDLWDGVAQRVAKAR